MDVVDRHPAARLLADLGAQIVEHRADLEPLLTETRVIREREPQVPGADDGDPELAIEAKDLP